MRFSLRLISVLSETVGLPNLRRTPAEPLIVRRVTLFVVGETIQSLLSRVSMVCILSSLTGTPGMASFRANNEAKAQTQRERGVTKPCLLILFLFLAFPHLLSSRDATF